MTLPPISTTPASGRSNPAIRRKVVVLPQPAWAEKRENLALLQLQTKAVNGRQFLGRVTLGQAFKTKEAHPTSHASGDCRKPPVLLYPSVVAIGA